MTLSSLLLPSLAAPPQFLKDREIQLQARILCLLLSQNGVTGQLGLNVAKNVMAQGLDSAKVSVNLIARLNKRSKTAT